MIECGFQVNHVLLRPIRSKLAASAIHQFTETDTIEGESQNSPHVALQYMGIACKE